MEPKSRLGTFFLLVGLVLLLLFVLSVMSKSINLTFLLLAFISLSLAFIARPRKESQGSGRFQSIRRLGEQSRQRREERDKKNPKK